MQQVYGFMMFAKVGHVIETTKTITYKERTRWESDYLLERYPDTPESNERYFWESIYVTIQHIVAISLLMIAIILLQKNLKWARRINPFILTIAFASDRPFFHVNANEYFVFTSCVNMATTYLFPMMIAETLAA